MTTAPLRSFRLNCAANHVPLVSALLAAQGFEAQDDPVFPGARRLRSGPFALGSSAAARFGFIYIQDRSSMLPPLVLDPEPGEAVLDMCAAPGGKTSLAADRVGPHGFVLACEPTSSRMATLRRNLSLLNLPQTATLGLSAETLPLPAGTPEAGFSRILLDPPCSGWGTVEKNPQVVRLWKDDKILPLVLLQRRLLREAFRLCAPGGTVVYSTCTTNVRENEEQLRFAVEKLGFAFRPAPPPSGFAFENTLLPEFTGALRTAPGPDGQGFFVALLHKPLDAPPAEAPPSIPSRRPVRPSRRPAWEEVPRDALESPGCDPALLPAGPVRSYNGTAHFLPARSLELIPEGVSWKGFPLGKVGPDGRVRVHPALRFLMPGSDEAENRGAAVLNLEDVAPVEALLRGESRTLSTAASEACLYFRGLPLCRLSLKNGRAVPPGLF